MSGAERPTDQEWAEPLLGMLEECRGTVAETRASMERIRALTAECRDILEEHRILMAEDVEAERAGGG